MNRTEEEWRHFARSVRQAVDGASSIGAVNAVEIHNEKVFADLKKDSLKMHEYLIDYIDKRRVELAKTVQKESVK